MKTFWLLLEKCKAKRLDKQADLYISRNMACNNTAWDTRHLHRCFDFCKRSAQVNRCKVGK